jgi:tetratricopeptide (TPR) repeat protein
MAQDDGLKAYQSGDYDNARKYYESILNEKDEDAAAQFGLGTTAFQQQDLQGALDAFQRALKTDNKELQSKAYYNIANTMASQQKNEEALTFYRKALELNPTDKDAKHNYEMFLHQKNQPDQLPPPETSEYAKQLKAHAEQLVDERQYKDAYELMIKGLNQDPTVGNFQGFIQRLTDIVEIIYDD